MTMATVKIAITQANDELAIMSFVTIGRGDMLPAGAEWVDKAAGQWMREPNAANINMEIARAAFLSHPVKGWRIIAERDIPEDRTYRNALRDKGDKLDYDMPTARQLHRDMLRNARAIQFLKLDGEWMRAIGQGKTAEAESIEMERQKLRELPNDPKIDTVATVDELQTLWP